MFAQKAGHPSCQHFFCKQRFRVTRKSRFSAKFRNHNANPVQLLDFFPAGPWGFPCSENQKLAQSLRMLGNWGKLLGVVRFVGPGGKIVGVTQNW